jgi:hypothetical protein
MAYNESPLAIAVLGHSGSQAPHEMQSSTMTMAMDVLLDSKNEYRPRMSQKATPRRNIWRCPRLVRERLPIARGEDLNVSLPAAARWFGPADRMLTRSVQSK